MSLESNRPKLTVIEGGGVRPSDWLNPPSTILGRNPFDRNSVASYRFSLVDIEKASLIGRTQPILDAWGNVRGELPPVNNIGRLSHRASALAGSRFDKAHACYRGLKRPIGADDRGWDYFAFVLKPSVRLVYRPSLSCVIDAIAVPDDLVFVIYARMDQPMNERFGFHPSAALPTMGVVTGWEFVEADGKLLNLPVEFESRYSRRMW